MFTSAEIGSLPEGTAGLIMSETGEPTQAFLRKQYLSDPGEDTWVLADNETSLEELLDEFVDDNEGTNGAAGNVYLLSSSGNEVIHTIPQVEASDEDEFDAARDALEKVLTALLPGSTILLGDTKTNYSTFALAYRSQDGWLVSGCGYQDYGNDAPSTPGRGDNPYLGVERVDKRTDDWDAESRFTGSFIAFPELVDTSTKQ